MGSGFYHNSLSIPQNRDDVNNKYIRFGRGVVLEVGVCV